MNNKYILPFEYKMKGKYKNFIKGNLSFSFSNEDNSFYNPLFIVSKGTKFSKPNSLNVKTDARLIKNSQIIDGFRVIRKDVEIKNQITLALNTLFSQNTSYGSVILSTSGIRIMSGFLQALFQDINSKKTRFISIISILNEETNEFLVKTKKTLENFENLIDLVQMKLKHIPYNIAPKNVKEKFEDKYTDNELKAVLISFLIGKSFRDQEVVAGIEKIKKIRGGGFYAKRIIEGYWGLNQKEYKGFMKGYSRQWLLDDLNSVINSPVNALTKLIKNTENNNIQKYIDNTFNGGEFVGTSGYASLPLISQFITKNDSMIDSFKFGIGDIKNINKKKNMYTTSISFDISDRSTWPKFSIINVFNDSAEILKQNKYNIFTSTDKFLHAKSYFYNEQLLIGSSNYTFSGSSSGNFELSIVTNNNNVKKEYKDWIKIIDKNSKNIKGNVINSLEQSASITDTLTILWKVIDKLVPKNNHESKSFSKYKETSEIYSTLFEYQKEAVSFIVNSLEENGVFLLADEVGLGKTPIALSVINFLKEKHGYNTAVLAPKNVIDSIWKPITTVPDNVFKKTWIFDYVSISEFSKDRSELISAEWFEQRKLIIIDESHFLRNTNNKRIIKYREYLEKAIENGSKILMLSATPIFNSFQDLTNQFNLGRKSTNMPRIAESFKEMDKASNPINQLVNDEVLCKWLSERFLSRSKEFIKEAYKYDEKMKLPSLFAKNINAKESEIENSLLEKIESLISGRAAPIIKFMLAKRLEESIDSFSKSLENILIKNNMKNVLQEYFNPSDDKHILFEDYIEEAKDINNILRNYTISDNIANEIKKMIKGLDISHFPKFEKLEEIILSESKRGIAIFTTSIPTAYSLYKIIIKRFPKLSIGMMTGKEIKTNSDVKEFVQTEKDLETLFSPNKMRSDIVDKILEENIGVIEDYKLDILIMTDKFSEGINLQDNGTLINFDAPWSPMVIQQRVGRLYRVNAEYKNINIYNLWPSEKLEQKVKMLERSLNKHSKAATIQRLPNVFEENFKEREYLFEKTSDEEGGNITNETLLDLFALRNEKLISTSKIKPGWYTVIEGEKQDIFNLFEIDGEFVLINGIDKINDNSLQNLFKLKKLLTKYQMIDKTTHNVFVEENYYDKEFTKILFSHISLLLNIKKIKNKKIKLITTIFVIKKIGEL